MYGEDIHPPKVRKGHRPTASLSVCPWTRLWLTCPRGVQSGRLSHLQQAALQGNLAEVKRLVPTVADIDACHGVRTTALHPFTRWYGVNMWWRGVLPCRAVLVPVPCACGVRLTVTRPWYCVAPTDRCQRLILGCGRRLQQNREGATDCRREPQQHQHGALRDGGGVQRWLVTRVAFHLAGWQELVAHLCGEGLRTHSDDADRCQR